MAAAYTAHFMRDLKTGAMSAQEVKTVTWLGKIGYAARGIVFALVGLIILQTAFAVGAKQAQGFDGALAALAHAPYGEILLGAVALGLILFGVYSALCAKWNKIGRRLSPHPAASPQRRLDLMTSTPAHAVAPHPAVTTRRSDPARAQPGYWRAIPP